MEYKQKCKYCGALLSNTNSVFIHINRYDDKGRSANQIWMCCKCWDNTQISAPNMKVKGGEFTCGNCQHLIFKNFKNEEGYCDQVRIYRNFMRRKCHE